MYDKQTGLSSGKSRKPCEGVFLPAVLESVSFKMLWSYIDGHSLLWLNGLKTSDLA